MSDVRKYIRKIEQKINGRHIVGVGLLYGDHMWPPFKLKNPFFIRIHFCGWFYHNSRSLLHTLYPNHWNENTNSILSSFVYWAMSNQAKVLYIVFDNHSTQKNNVVLAFFYYLVKFRGLFNKVFLN